MAWLLLSRGLRWCVISILMLSGPGMVLGGCWVMMAFLGFKWGMRSLRVCLKCWHSSAVGASCFYHSVLPLVLQASKIMEEKKRRVVLLSGEVWLLLFACLFAFFLSFDCFVFSLFQTAGSVSFIRLIDDGQCGYMENRTCLNSWILLCLLILMRLDEIDGIAVSNTASAVIMHFFWLGQKSLAWNPCGTQPANLKLGKGLATVLV